MSAFAIPKVKRIAVFVKERRDSRDVYDRRPWDFVDYDFGTDEPLRNKRYIQLRYDSADSRSARNPIDGLYIFDTPPAGDVAGAGSTF
jgi:hypothetical protein